MIYTFYLIRWCYYRKPLIWIWAISRYIFLSAHANTVVWDKNCIYSKPCLFLLLILCSFIVTFPFRTCLQHSLFQTHAICIHLADVLLHLLLTFGLRRINPLQSSPLCWILLEYFAIDSFLFTNPSSPSLLLLVLLKISLHYFSLFIVEFSWTYLFGWACQEEFQSEAD